MLRKSLAVLAGLLITTGAWWTMPAAATVMVELLLEDMARDADAIVHGSVEQSGTQLALQTHGAPEPYTVTTLRVRTWFKGAGAERIVIREQGGEWQGGGRWIDGTPWYRPGEEVVVFLRRDPERPDYYRTYGMVQGKFVVRQGVGGVPTTVRRDLGSIAFAHWTDGEMTVQQAGPEPAMQFDALEDRILRVLSLGGGR